MVSLSRIVHIVRTEGVRGLYQRGRDKLTPPNYAKDRLEELVEKIEAAVGAPVAVDDLYREAKTINFPAVEQPDVTIVVPVFNKIEYTLRCLRALSRQETSYTF